MLDEPPLIVRMPGLAACMDDRLVPPERGGFTQNFPGRQRRQGHDHARAPIGDRPDALSSLNLRIRYALSSPLVEDHLAQVFFQRELSLLVGLPDTTDIDKRAGDRRRFPNPLPI